MNAIQPMQRLDQWTDRLSRELARRSSRRNFVSRLGVWLVGGALAPLLLPVSKVHAQTADTEPAEVGDRRDCEYWRYCALSGPLCSCCGGDANKCPPGTELSRMAWIGTCRNPADGKQYLISYNDCCGKSICHQCPCHRHESEMPVYRVAQASDVHWCAANERVAVTCTLALVLGTAE